MSYHWANGHYGAFNANCRAGVCHSINVNSKIFAFYLFILYYCWIRSFEHFFNFFFFRHIFVCVSCYFGQKFCDGVKCKINNAIYTWHKHNKPINYRNSASVTLTHSRAIVCRWLEWQRKSAKQRRKDKSQITIDCGASEHALAASAVRDLKTFCHFRDRIAVRWIRSHQRLSTDMTSGKKKKKSIGHRLFG